MPIILRKITVLLFLLLLSMRRVGYELLSKTKKLFTLSSCSCAVLIPFGWAVSKSRNVWCNISTLEMNQNFHVNPEPLTGINVKMTRRRTQLELMKLSDTSLQTWVDPLAWRKILGISAPCFYSCHLIFLTAEPCNKGTCYYWFYWVFWDTDAYACSQRNGLIPLHPV